MVPSNRRAFMKSGGLLVAAVALPRRFAVGGVDERGKIGKIMLENRASGAILSIEADRVMDNFGKAQQWDPLGPTGTRQHFLAVPTSEKNVYKLESRASGKLLSIDANHIHEDGALCVQWDDHGGTDADVSGQHQRWRFEELSNGLFKLINARSEKALAVDANELKLRGGRVIQWEYGAGGVSWFQWRLRTW
jgi:Ricin-type beta-trefoil lectin domain-like